MANIYDHNGNVIATGGSVEIANDLVTNSATKALAAAQGVVLRQMIGADPPIPDGLQKYDYTGAEVNFENKHKVAQRVIKTLASTGGVYANQGGACFGNLFFSFGDNNNTCWIFNMVDGSLVQTLTGYDKGWVSNCHCNSVNFSKIYYDNNDPLPLLYVSTGYASNGYSGALVYRVVVTTSGGVASYELRKIQEIKVMDKWTDLFLGDDGDIYIKYSYYDENSVLIANILRFYLPSISESEVFLDITKPLNTYVLTADGDKGQANQNFLYINGKVYLTSGGGSGGTNGGYFQRIDLATCSRDVMIDLISIGITTEPEACFIWDGKLCINGRNHNKIYALYFE